MAKLIDGKPIYRGGSMDTPFSDLANNGAIPSGVALLFSLTPRQLRM